ncbi:uncharacterized protein LOC119729069 [Patiria miniata]|uniref:Uncharacterized protein n=1 Tax=Patiria miniata TaxID=46514 RepID=A0A914A0Z9_PATMI|nr:uncharacterized protein LOC119729069 [Patiria miniata]
MDISTQTSNDSSPNLSESSIEAFLVENMSTILYVLAAAIIIVCFTIHGCLFYRRWKRRRRTTSAEDKEIGWSPMRNANKDKVTGSSRENSVVSCTDSDQRSRSDSVQILHEAKSSTKSLLLDQDLSDRRRSSSIRIKVLPPPAIIRSTSGPDQPTQRPSDESHHEASKRGSDPQPAKAAVIAELAGLGSIKAPTVFVAERSDASKPSCVTDKIPNDVNSPGYAQIGGSSSNVASVPKSNNLDRSQSGSNRSVPAILHTQPSEEKYDHLEPRDLTKRATVTRQNKDSPEVKKLKRRSYSFDDVPAFESTGDLEPNWQIPGPVRGRSASESQPVPKSVKSQTGVSKPDPVYFILEPGSDIDTLSRNDKRYRTLPPIKSTAGQPTSPIKRKFTFNTLFSRKSKRTEKRKDKHGAQTPPSSPSKSSVDENQPVIYEEPEGVRVLDPTDLQGYATVNPDSQLDVREDRGGKSDGGSPSKSKSSILKSFHKIRTKSKTFKSTSQKRPVRNICDDLNGAYEVLEIPMGDSATAGGPVYDTPGSDVSANQAASKNLTVIGTTNTGAPLKQYQPGSARRELPNTPNEYDVIERGAITSQGAISRSKSAKPNLRGASTKALTQYDKLGPMVPDRLKAIDMSRPSSSPEPAKRGTDRVYDLLNPKTMGSSDIRNGGKPRVSPKPQSLRGLPRSSDYDLLFSGKLSRHGSFCAGPNPKSAPRPLLRANSLKLRKISPETSPKPSRIKPGKPSQVKPPLSSKPAEPVYFTLDPNSTAEPI